MNLQTAWLSPPVALSAYFLKGVAPQWQLGDIYKGMMQFMVLQLVGLALVMTLSADRAVAARRTLHEVEEHAMEYLKKAAKTPETETGAARKVVDEMLAAIAQRGEAGGARLRAEARPVDRRDRRHAARRSSAARRRLPDSVKRDIEFATAQVRALRASAARLAAAISPPSCGPA